MPSLEQIIRPFVVKPVTPPAQRATASHAPAAQPVRLNIGIGQQDPSTLNAPVAPTWPFVHSLVGKSLQSFAYRKGR